MSNASPSSDWIDEPTAVREGDALDRAALEAYLRERELLDAGGALAIEQFPSGFSNLTYLVRAGKGEAARELVLRRPPFGADIATAHDMEREHTILAALDAVYPKAPAPLLFCEDEGVLGAPFYLMERVEGAILRPDATEKDATEKDAPAPEEMTRFADAFVESFAELHAVDYEAAGLGELGHPEGYVKRQLEGWAKRYRNAKTDDIPAMERVAAWLREHQPPESGAALIHNDFKYDNLVAAPGDWSGVRAVLDWEMATVGDPLMDLGTTLGYWVEPSDPPMMKEMSLNASTLPGNPSRRELAEHYAEASGRDLGPLVFYYVYGLFKIAVIIQQIYQRYEAGHTRDERFAGLIEGVRGCGRIAAQSIEKDRIDDLF